MPAQTYRERSPGAPQVASAWIQLVADGFEPHRHRTIPHGSVELRCEIGGRPQVVGPQTVARVGTLAPGTTVVGIRLRLGAARAVLGVPASELVDLTVGAEELWGPAGERIGELVASAATAEDAASALEAAALARAVEPEPDPVAAGAAALLLPGRSEDVASLSSKLYVSERTLRRRVDDAIGLAPKVVHRMLRFQGFLALAHGREGDPAELAMLAAEAGYADQSHLTRESLRLAGLSPRALLQESLEDCRRAGHDHSVSYAPLLAGLA
jgi:AraC-like DNA-binding protein